VDLCAVGLLLVWDCAAGINKAKQKTDTIKRAITLENFCIVFSFLMISPLFVQRTIWREKLNKQIHWVKVDCAPKSNRARLIRYCAHKRAAALKIGRARKRAAPYQFSISTVGDLLTRMRFL
jgi:hypothetical protein